MIDRKLLALGAAVLAVAAAVAGVGLVVAPAGPCHDTLAAHVPQAAFEVRYDDGRVRVRHDGGDPLPAGRSDRLSLVVHSADGPATAERTLAGGGDFPVTEGDRFAVAAPRVRGDPVAEGDRLLVVYRGQDQEVAAWCPNAGSANDVSATLAAETVGDG